VGNGRDEKLIHRNLKRRPGRIWEGNIKIDLKETRYEVVACIHLA